MGTPLNQEYLSLTIGLIIIHVLVVAFGVGWFLIYRVLRRGHERQTSWHHRLLMNIMAPVSFTTIFLHNRREAQLPLYFRLFLKFTRFCSKIPYFHFLPKFIIATVSELLIYYITGQKLLTGLVFLWSMSFFIFISFIESNFGELDEESITLANKLFLYSVSLLTLAGLIVGIFFWDLVEPFFDNGFWHFIAGVAKMFNDLLIMIIEFFLRHPLAIVGALVLLVIYVSSSLYLSEYMRRKK